MSAGTGHTYKTWTRRLATAHPNDAPRSLTAGDLKDLIARHVLAGRRDDDRRRSGRSAEENAVGAFRSLWGYFVEKGWADENVALRLSKPGRAEPNRRPIQPDEAVLLRHLAKATGRDLLLDEVTLSLPERLGLRRIELCRLRLCDVDLERNEVEVWGKGDKPRTMPLPPVLAALLAVYVEDRRPRHLSPAEWLASEEGLLRSRPTPAHLLGRAAGRRRIEDLFERAPGHGTAGLRQGRRLPALLPPRSRHLRRRPLRPGRHPGRPRPHVPPVGHRLLRPRDNGTEGRSHRRLRGPRHRP